MNKMHQTKIAESVNVMLRQLQKVELQSLLPQGYAGEYLLYLLKHKHHYVRIYKNIIEYLVECKKIVPENCRFIDYGTGNGLLAIFASVVGFSKVTAIDVDASFIQTAEQTATLMGVNHIEFFVGGEDQLKHVLTANMQTVIAGTDVIEHIYDLDLFFDALSQIHNLEAMIFTTASNPENPFIVKKLKALQIKEELYGGSSNDRHLFGEAHSSFISVRASILKEHYPQMDEATIARLAKTTRGLKKNAILAGADTFIKTGVVPQEPAHPTNTCNPETGSWSERLTDIAAYRKLYNRSGFSFFVSNGYYDSYKGNVFKRGLVSLINWFLKAFPKNGIYISPFIFLRGFRQKEKIPL